MHRFDSFIFKTGAWQVFIGFAEQDRDSYESLLKHLRPLSDRSIMPLPSILPGAEWREEEHQKISEADLVLLLVSADYLGTDRGVQQIEWALGRMDPRLVVPVLVRPCMWDQSPLGDLQPVPANRRPVTKWENADEAWLDVVRGIQQLCMPEERRRDLNASPNFSLGLIDQMARLHRKIEQLTEDQCSVIKELQDHDRCVISGCAGSGKTLIAAEKARRLDDAGIKTLLLCHNPFLAEWLRQLTADSSVKVRDFYAFIREILDQPADRPVNWSHYEEPIEAEIAAAHGRLKKRGKRDRYGAVIVDEGQDFRETWWPLVTEALREPDSGHLYVFHDSNQALLLHRGGPPSDLHSRALLKNCRNAGKIFSVMRRFHDGAQEPAFDLAGHGVVRCFQCSPRKEREAVTEAIQSAIHDLPLERLVVLTTEPEPVSQSLICGLRVELPLPWRWQDVVTNHIRWYTDRLRPRPRGTGLPLVLSNAQTPTAEDVQTISGWVNRLIQKLHGKGDRVGHPFWRVDGTKLSLIGPGNLSMLSFFSSPAWAEGLPRPEVAQVVPGQGRPAASGEIRLYTISAFKGLEADGVIFFDTLGLRRSAMSYVGISRAVGLLYVVSEAASILKDYVAPPVAG